MNKDKRQRNMLVSHSTKHINDWKQLSLKHRKITDKLISDELITEELKSSTGLLLFSMLYLNILRTSISLEQFEYPQNNAYSLIMYSQLGLSPCKCFYRTCNINQRGYLQLGHPPLAKI